LFTSIVSRNHPDYFGQGTFIRDDYSIDFVALAKEKGMDLAIINSKIFDLSKGRTLILCQDSDHRYMLRDIQISDTSMVLISNLKMYLTGVLGKVIR